jgi:hypothetical protein
VALLGVNPNQAREVLRCETELRPVLAAFVVALVGGGAAEGESKTDYETEDCKEELVDTDCQLSALSSWTLSPMVGVQDALTTRNVGKSST